MKGLTSHPRYCYNVMIQTQTYLTLVKIVGQVLHGISPYHMNVLVLPWVGFS